MTDLRREYLSASPEQRAKLWKRTMDRWVKSGQKLTAAFARLNTALQRAAKSKSMMK